VTSDHCSFNIKGQKELGRGDFTKIPNGGPGIEERLTMVYQGVNERRITLNRFVELVATGPARMFGLYPHKGTIAVGSDADLVIWNPGAEMTVTNAALHHNVDYTLYEGKKVRGLPATVTLRGDVIVENRQYVGTPGKREIPPAYEIRRLVILSEAKDPPTVDGARIQAMLDELHAIGRRPSGTFRGLYSPAWREAQERIKRWMSDAGLEVRVDAVGSVWGHLAGKEPGPPIVAGSHFDTVPDGGKYDGQLGHVGAIVAVDALRRQLGQPRRSLAVLAACEEEGSRFTCNFWASRAITGAIGPDEPNQLRDFDGVLLADEMRACGLDPARVADAATNEIGAFLELHIEQGPILARLQDAAGSGSPRIVGAVTAITGTGRLHVTLTGQPDHTGSTPMPGRRDALLAPPRSPWPSASTHSAPVRSPG